MWRIAADSGSLDLNSSYAYLLWCRDFSATSIVGIDDGAPVGFVTGYVRPDQPDTFVVWQVAVDAAHRGRGIAGRLLTEVVDRLDDPSVCWLETTITPSNDASIALFTAFARSRSCDLEQAPLFRAEQFPDGHDTEVLFRIGPRRARCRAPPPCAASTWCSGQTHKGDHHGGRHLRNDGVRGS